MFKRTRDYAKDYKVEDRLENGRVKRITVYTGKYYKFEGDDGENRRIKRRYGLLAFLAFACYVGLLFLPASSMGAGSDLAFYVAIPCILLLLPAGITAGKTVMLLFTGRRMVRADYDKYVVLLKGYTVAYLILAAATALAQLVYLCIRGFSLADGAFAGLALVETGIVFLYWRLQKKYVCSEDGI